MWRSVTAVQGASRGLSERGRSEVVVLVKEVLWVTAVRFGTLVVNSDGWGTAVFLIATRNVIGYTAHCDQELQT
jgi:hypothetical protein